MEKAYITSLHKENSSLVKAKVKSEDFAQVYDDYYKRIYNYMRYRLGKRELAEELTSQVFERSFRKLKSYNPEKASFAAWIFAIAHNTVTDFYRARRRKYWVSLEAIWDKVSPEPGPEEVAVKKEEREKILKALSSLEEREREIIAMKFAGGLKNTTIAELMGLTDSNVGVILYRSMKKLQKELKGKGMGS